MSALIVILIVAAAVVVLLGAFAVMRSRQRSGDVVASRPVNTPGGGS